MKSMTSSRLALGAAATALLLTACGGGDGGGPPVDADPTVPGTEVPLSATTSSAGALAFVKRVAASSDDTAAPIAVGDAVLASSDTDEPDPGI
jgi:hypothetical protein